MGTKVLVGATIVALAVATPVWGKDITVTVDGRSAPWNTGINPKLRFGLADARPPKVVFDPMIQPGVKITFKASGTTTTYGDMQSFDANGDQGFCGDRGGLALFPSHYTSRRKVGCLNGLVGAFISPDGTVVGEPFMIGTQGEADVPVGAVALSLGVNDDRYADNSGLLTVHVHIPEPEVTVEQVPAAGDK